MRRGIVAAVTLLLVLGAAGWHHFRPGASTACQADRSQAKQPPKGVPGTGTAAFILGDSWTSGWHLPDARQSFAYVLAARKGWSAQVAGFADTGYVNPGSCGGETFADRIGGLRSDTRLVVVEGGLNDVGQLAKEQRAVADLLAQIRQRAPQAAVYVIAPPRVPLYPAADLDRIADAQRQAAMAAGVKFVDPERVPLEYQPDGLHLTARGHQQFAGWLAGHVR